MIYVRLSTMNLIRKALLIAPLLLLPACSTLSYYAQAIDGHMDIMGRREPIEDILADTERDRELRNRLQGAQEMRDFASRELALPDNDSYRSYVELDRPYATYVVFATQELSLVPEEWCFLFVGCLAYRGYYDREDAERFADTLRAKGLDVYVGGSVAYSTLGWFDDPLLSTMFHGGETRVAGLIFHELAHQQLYIKGDTVFNESFATTVEEAGVRIWLSDRESASMAYESWLLRKLGFIKLVQSTRARLGEIYTSEMSDERKRAAKQAAIEHMREEYERLKASWGGVNDYDAWFGGPINNAKLAALGVYRDFVPDFGRWLAACEGDFGRFYEAMDELADESEEVRHETLRGPARCVGGK